MPKKNYEIFNMTRIFLGVFFASCPIWFISKSFFRLTSCCMIIFWNELCQIHTMFLQVGCKLVQSINLSNLVSSDMVYFIHEQLTVSVIREVVVRKMSNLSNTHRCRLNKLWHGVVRSSSSGSCLTLIKLSLGFEFVLEKEKTTLGQLSPPRFECGISNRIVSRWG